MLINLVFSQTDIREFYTYNKPCYFIPVNLKVKDNLKTADEDEEKDNPDDDDDLCEIIEFGA